MLSRAANTPGIPGEHNRVLIRVDITEAAAITGQ